MDESEVIQQQVQDAEAKLASSAEIKTISDFVTRVMLNSMNTGLSALECLGLTPSSLEGYYKKSYQLYAAGKFSEAKKILIMLVMLCPIEHKWAFALAACHHRSGEYKLALASYQQASIGDPTDPLPYYHAADCLLKLKMEAAAAEALRIAIKNCGSDLNYAAVKDRASLALKKMRVSS